MGDRLTVSTELAAYRDQQDLVEQASRAFLHSLVQTPVSGVVQLVDKACGTQMLPSVQFVAPPPEAQGWSDWHVQQIAGAAGMLPWFIGLHKAGSMLGNKILTAKGVGLSQEVAAERFLSRKTAVEVGAATFSGLTYGGLLMPTRPDEDAVGGRFRNAACSALTFATLSASMRGADALGVKSPFLTGTLSGIPAGVVAAESHSLLSGKGPASLKELGTSIYSFSLIGGGFGFVQGRMESRSPSRAQDSRAQAAELSGHAANRDVALDLPAPFAVASRARTPAELVVGSSVEMPVGGKPNTLDVLSLSERFAVVRLRTPLDKPVERVTISESEFADRYRPLEVTIDGQAQTRYMLKGSDGSPGLWRAERLGPRVRLTEEPALAAVDRPVLAQWADTALLKSSGTGGVDWSIVGPLRGELQGGPQPRGPYDVLMGHELVFTTGTELGIDNISLRARGDTNATASKTTGRIVLEKPGQPWIAEMKDGRLVTVESPGPWEVATPSGKVIAKDRSGNVRTFNWSGVLQREVQTGASMARGGEPPVVPDLLRPQTGAVGAAEGLHVLRQVESAGSRTDWLSDGTVVEYKQGFRDWRATKSDGTLFTRESPGPWEIVDSFGCKLTKDAEGTIRKQEGKLLRTWRTDGTEITENLTSTAGIKYTEVKQNGLADLRIYDDPAVPNQKVTQKNVIDRATGDYLWECTDSTGRTFNQHSDGPWEVTLLQGTRLRKDAAGNVTRHR